MGWYGARVHVNLLGLLRNTAHSRWTVAVSPHLYAVTTCADIQTLADHAEVVKGSTRWHLGYGASLQAGYQLTSNLNLGIYSGLTRLSGERMDGMPEHLHKNNFVWESGIRLGISLAKTKKEKLMETSLMPQQEVLKQETQQEVLKQETQQQESAPEVNTAKQLQTKDKAETKVAVQGAAESAKVTFPAIYFGFNRITIRPSEVSKLKNILCILKENPEMKVTVTGWCDTRGSVAVNRRISRQRAQALKNWLVKRGIAASRISVVGKGSDGSRTASKARRVETTNHHL